MALPATIKTRTQDEVFTDQVGGPSAARIYSQLPDMGAVYAGLADFGKHVEQIGVDAALPTMEAKGADAVIRDPATGNLSVQPRLVLNSLDAAYNHGQATAFAAQAESDQTAALEDLKQHFVDDPKGFREAATAVVKKQAGAPGISPELRAPILAAGLQKVTQYAGGLQTQKVALDFKKFAGSIQAQIDQKTADALQLANQHGAHTPEFEQLAGEIDSLRGTMETNPLFAYSPEQHHADMVELHGQAVVQAALGTFDLALSKNGSAKALQSVETMLHSPGMGLQPQQVHAFESEFHAMVNERDAQIAHADAMSARNMRLMYDSNAKDGIELAAQGGLTTQWVIAHKRNLDLTDFASLLRTASAPAAHDDAATVASLMPRVYVDGDPTARADVTADLQAGRLTPDTAAKFYNELGQSTPPEVKRWQSYLVGRMKPSTIEGKFDPDAADRMQGALEDYRDFAARTPRATSQQLRQQADDLLAIHSLGGAISARPGFTGTRVPLLVGTLDKPDVGKSATNIKARYLALHGGNQAAAMADPSFLIDMRRLKEIADRAGYLSSIEQGAFSGTNGQP